MTTRSFKSKTPWRVAMDIAAELRKYLEKEGCKRVDVCGSVRRCKPEVGDLDLVIDADPLTLKDKPWWTWVEGGKSKATLEFMGMQVNLLRSTEESWGAAMLYFTGPHDYNIAYRARAKRLGLLLNEKGLFLNDPGLGKGTMVAGRTEEDIYKALGKEYKVPEERGK